MRFYPIFILIFLLFLSCKQGPKISDKKVSPENPDYAEMGMSYAQETQKVLGKALMGTIQNKGVKEAVVFCNEKAYPLTDSMATKFNARIKRVSDKPRNPNNKANATELAHIETFKKAIVSGDSIAPILDKANGEVYFYYPIVTKGLCLNCHGSPEKNIAPEVLTHLSEFYPEDKAVGYGPDEVRGIWSIVFDASKNPD
ncbi:DUF3365 domain-containing protein [Flagellimonas halotolerans]|uniref:DUF3365 domain-containing protein n=1 Tax=Flagellimonas halotolerans TaxID=3112164 RepID=A0ABU6ILS6_9FLAO|nr:MULTISPECIES: DUF3365 domain-containing protein [unclassified Allomuricauda]MEC3964188.1 DUF3365 domain-containing protein [Muricauda sp. SYSU M86414]MEC4264058.1 DUF3365 domain-containing protein [Muricauda sp. SYSU M84420]